MKSLLTGLILLLSSTMVFAQATTPCTLEEGGKCAMIYLKDGEFINGATIDATGFMHAFEMNVPGTAHLTNVTIKNAGTPGWTTADGKHGNGRGLVVVGAGARVIVNGGSSNNNSEDGYRVLNGGELNITNSSANNNGKIGFFAGENGTLVVTGGSATGNSFGVMGSKFAQIEVHGGKFENNTSQGIQVISGNSFVMDQNAILLNNGGDKLAEDYPWGGIAIFGVFNSRITDTTITGTKGSGILVESDTEFKDPRAYLRMESVTVSQDTSAHASDPDFVDQAILSSGNSVVEIFTSNITGRCQSKIDLSGGTDSGVIKVDGKTLDVDVDCP